ncbi:hypothetical protein [Providencia stuartii]|uniref:hypothetical protein n=1 Tax=Providencia stuartii TaxID=588 RepID=UPI001E5EAF66|nr:hypothetical protein [Providencia stuartii]
MGKYPTVYCLDDTSSAANAGQAGKTTVENNSMSNFFGARGDKYFEGAFTLENALTSDDSLTAQEKEQIRKQYIRGDGHEDPIKAILENNPGSDTIMALIQAKDTGDYALAVLSSLPMERALAVLGKLSKAFKTTEKVVSPEIAIKNPSSKLPSNPRSQSSSDVWKPNDSKLYVDGVLSDVKSKEIVNIPHGQRPDPSTYMTKSEIDAHLAKFDDGAVRFTSKNSYNKFNTAGPDGGFVMPAAEFDKVMVEAKGNLSVVEKKLGLDKGYLSNSDTMAVYIKKEDFKGLKVPSGNEPGANQYWTPGGKTSGGVSEAVMDFSHKPKVEVVDINNYKKIK